MSRTASEEPWTVLRLLEWTTGFFRERGSASPRLDAEVLLAHARGCARIDLYAAFADVPDEESRVAFRELVRRRGEGAPVAHLVGYKEFYSLRFRVNETTLIPRPETEHLVLEVLDSIAKFRKEGQDPASIQVADIGTGSGAIAVAVAKHSQAQVTAVDISPPALEIAKWNAEQHEVLSQVRFYESDLLANVDEPVQFDIIASNPPYVSDAEFESLAKDVRNFEPKTALVAGEFGTEVIQRLFDVGADRLRTGGHMMVELSPMIADRCEAMAEEHSAFGAPRLVKDLDGHLRVIVVEKV